VEPRWRTREVLRSARPPITEKITGIPMATVQRWTGAETKALRQAMRLSIRAFAAHLGVDARTVNKWEARGTTITLLPDTQAVLDTALNRAPDDVKTRFTQAGATQQPASDEHAALSAASSHGLQWAAWQSVSRGGDEHEALELVRRVVASDVSAETLDRLEGMVDELAVKYPVTPPQELVGPVRQHVSYVMRLLDARKTLDEHRRLLIVGAWLSLIAATLYIDLEHRDYGESGTSRT
jgi:transcriptional regulator with XRE-family HTH domain